MTDKSPLGRPLSRAELARLRHAKAIAQNKHGLGGLEKRHSKPKPITLRRPKGEE